MVIESLEPILLGVIALVATLTSIAGMVVLSSFFHNKLKNLFSDVNYFIFFFLVAGYFLYALGEVSFYLSTKVLGSTSPIGIQDVYWSIGGVIILVSFLAIGKVLYREAGNGSKALLHFVFSLIAVGLTLFAVVGVGGFDTVYFFSIFYPLVSSLVVSSSFSTILFLNRTGTFGKILVLFFLASSSILLADVFFHFANQESVYGTFSITADIFYISGYALSLIAFISMRLKMHSLLWNQQQ